MNPVQARARLRILKRWMAPIILAALVIQLAAGWTATSFVVLLCVISATFVWFGWQSIRHLARQVRLRLAGHVTTAMIAGYRRDEDSDDQGYLALVSFVTNVGEPHPLTPLTSQYETPPQNTGDGAERRTRGAGEMPPIGHTLRLVYDPSDPTWVDERLSWTQVAFTATCCVVAILLCGALLIGTLATEMPGFEHKATERAAGKR
jgi:hypothetical protein